MSFPALDRLTGPQPQPFERAIETALVRVLRDRYAHPDGFLAGAEVIEGHREAELLADPADPDAPPSDQVLRAMRGRVVIAGIQQEEDEGEERCMLEVTIHVDLGFRSEQRPAIADHDRWVQGIRATFSASFIDQIREAVFALDDPLPGVVLMGMVREGASITMMEGTALWTTHIYTARGFLAANDDS